MDIEIFLNIPLRYLKDQRGIFGALFGGKAKKSKSDKAAAAALQAQIDLQREQQALLRPLQQQQIGVTGELLGTAREPALEAFRTELSAPERETLEGQFAQAKEGVLQSGQRGGLMRAMLGNVDLARAQAVSRAINQAKQQGIGRALTFASGQNPLNITSALMGGAQGLTGSAQAAAEAAGRAQGTLGGGVGGLLGLGLATFGGPIMRKIGGLFGGPAATAANYPGYGYD